MNRDQGAPSSFDGVKATFDDNVASYIRQIETACGPIAGDHDFFMRHKAQLVRDFIAKHLPGRRVRLLDVGCGMGLMHRYLADGNVDLHGVDISEKAISFAAANNPHATYHVQHGDRVPLEAGTFDLAFATCVLHHVPVSMWGTFLAEMKRVVRPGGFVMVIEHNPLNPATQWVVRRCDLDRDAVLLAPWKLTRLFRQAKLRAINSSSILFTPFSAPLFRAVDRILSRIPLGAQNVVYGMKQESEEG